MERNDDPKSGKAGAAALDLEIEELEPIVAPSGKVVFNSNETLLADLEQDDNRFESSLR